MLCVRVAWVKRSSPLMMFSANESRLDRAFGFATKAHSVIREKKYAVDHSALDRISRVASRLDRCIQPGAYNQPAFD